MKISDIFMNQENFKEKLLNKIHYIVVFLIFIFIAFLTESFLFFYKHNQNNLLREKVTIEANKVQTALHNEINSSLNLVIGLVGYINTVDELTPEKFNRIAEVILSESEIIRNIGLAPGNVISFMYPLEGNRKALGMDYMKNTQQRGAVLKAVETGITVIAGPVNLVQGGRGFIARIPIYRGKNREDYWGIASIVVDEKKLYDRVDILQNNVWIKYALRGRDAGGIDGEIFFGDKDVFDSDPVTYKVVLPEGSWVLAASPENGWNNVRLKNVLTIRFSGYLIAVILSFLLLNLIRSNIKLNFYAHVDPLTGIANRRCFHFVSEKILLREKRENGSLYFIFFDLDGFKTVNDRYGHKAGDAVLKEAVKRIIKNTRESDIFARMGGDEFLFVPLSVKRKEDAVCLADKIVNELSMPFVFEKNSIQIGCSVGISLYPEDGEMIDDLMKKADQAMYSSKSKKGNCITFYSDIETVIY